MLEGFSFAGLGPIIMSWYTVQSLMVLMLVVLDVEHNVLTRLSLGTIGLLANSADPDQTPQMRRLISVSSVCNHLSHFLLEYLNHIA